MELTGQHEAARAAYQTALAQLPGDAPFCRARLQQKAGTTWANQGQFDDARHAYGMAATSLGQEPIELDREWWREWIQIQLEWMQLHYWLAQVGELTELIEKTRPLVERHGTPAQRGRFFLSCMQMAVRRDRYVVSEETLASAQAYLAASEQSKGLEELANARFVLGFCHLSSTRFNGQRSGR